MVSQEPAKLSCALAQSGFESRRLRQKARTAILTSRIVKRLRHFPTKKKLRVQFPFPDKVSALNIADWCNGNTAVFDTVVIGSSPVSAAKGVTSPIPLKQCGKVEGRTTGFIPAQSNGKTADSDSAFSGSNPLAGANGLLAEVVNAPEPLSFRDLF